MSFHPESSSSLPAGAAPASAGGSMTDLEGVSAEAGASPVDVPRPIGPERLRALREAIEKGTYPTRDDVLGGLERLLDRPQ